MALNSLVTTMAFHTYLAHVVAKTSDIPVGTGRSRLFSLRSKNRPISQKLQKANKLNTAAKVICAVSIGFFNLIFWAIAMQEYFKPAEQYL